MMTKNTNALMRHYKEHWDFLKYGTQFDYSATPSHITATKECGNLTISLHLISLNGGHAHCETKHDTRLISFPLNITNMQSWSDARNIGSNLTPF